MTSLEVKLKGPAVSEGSIDLIQLAKFSEGLQKVVDQVAYSLEKESGSKRKLSEVKKDTSLRLISTAKGSFKATIVVKQPQMLFAGHSDIARKAIGKLVKGLVLIKSLEVGKLPSGYDQGVLTVLKNLGALFKKDIDSIQFDFHEGDEKYSGIYDQPIYDKVVENISEPEEKLVTIRGDLLMVNFGEGKYQCHLYLNEKQYITCTFNEDIIDILDETIRHYVSVIGIGTIDPVTEEVTKLHICEITVLDKDNIHEQELEDAFNAYLEEYDTVASFKRGWNESMTGKGHPIETLWDGIDAS